MTAIVSFLGSAVFRWLLEKVFSLAERSQDHRQEIERMREQADIDAAQHARNLEMLETQSRLRIELAQQEVRGVVEQTDAQAFLESIKGAAGERTGLLALDAWNGAIRPFVSTVCVLVWLWLLAEFVPPYVASLTSLEKMALAVTLVEFTINLVATVIGWHFGTRALLPGKK